MGNALSGLPLVGEQVRGLTVSAFGTAGEPFVYVGDQLEQLLMIIAALLGILVLGVTLVPVVDPVPPMASAPPVELRTAHRAIRGSTRDVPDVAVQRLLASRALHRLTYGELLQHTPNPIGDFAAGRYDRLARAELGARRAQAVTEGPRPVSDSVEPGGSDGSRRSGSTRG